MTFFFKIVFWGHGESNRGHWELKVSTLPIQPPVPLSVSWTGAGADENNDKWLNWDVINK